MNKQDITIVILLVALLAGWLFYQNKQVGARRAEILRQQREMLTNGVPPAALSPDASASAAFGNDSQKPPVKQESLDASETNETAEIEIVEESTLPARIFTLRDKDRSLTLSSKGATIQDATLLGYRKTIEKDSGDFAFSFTNHPALALQGLQGLGGRSDFKLISQSETSAVFRAESSTGLTVVRTIALLPEYKIGVHDTLENVSGKTITLPAHSIAMGEVSRLEKTKTNMLAVDNLAAPANGGKKLGKVDHWEKDGRLFSILTGRRGGGCSSAASQKAGNLPESGYTDVTAVQEWVALKSRFFVQVFSAPENTGCRINVERELGKDVPLVISSVYGSMNFNGAQLAAGDTLERSYSLYIGPKKLSVIRHFGPKTGEIMDFGFFAWFCNLLVPVLNFLYLICHNYGIAIILLTLIIRMLFWPLTHKSNDGMKRLQMIQPELKEVQTKFKDDPQKLQQETMRIYRENKVNPMSSCLPMLIQIPVFIALFTILRSAVELRFAPFLWIADLSEPENLLKGVIPHLPALNILPILMCVTMYLQSRMTPSMGDQGQQKMMAIMMPLIMLFMFYSMPSALLLYWTVSQALAIAQLAWQKRQGQKAAKASNAVIEGEVLSRQARRRAEREEQ